MANNVFNKLEIIGSDDQVKQIREFLKGKPYTDGSKKYVDFNNIVRMPEELINTIKSPDSVEQSNGYDWCCENWGTKWNAFTQIKISENILTFETAWCGIPNLVQKLSREFSVVTFTYDWNDYFENHHYVIVGGEIVNKSCSDVLYETIGHPEEGLKTSFNIRDESPSIYKGIIDQPNPRDLSDFDICSALIVKGEGRKGNS